MAGQKVDEKVHWLVAWKVVHWVGLLVALSVASTAFLTVVTMADLMAVRSVL
jgi:hypothetical protein